MKDVDKWKRGLPYIGSKGQKAQQIIDLLPSGKRFIDVFGGGGSISLTASNSGKWDKVIYNEKRKFVVSLLKALIYDSPHIDLEKYVYITRKEFFDWRDNKPDSIERTLILLSRSFSNNMKDYLWGKKIASLKLTATRGMFYGDTNSLYDELFTLCRNETSIKDKYRIFRKWRRKKVQEKNNIQIDRLEQLEKVQQLEQLLQLQQLERLQRLEQLQQLERLEFIDGDYRNLDIKENDVIYCDPPYVNTSKQYDGFNNEEFDKWLKQLPTDNIFISEYTVRPNTTLFFDLGNKHSLTSNGKRRSELLLKYVHH